MNQDRDRHEATEIDPQVSEAYASLADEKTPPELDRVVIRKSTRAVQADNRRGAFGAWSRPVAFMATVGLSLAIILELSDTSIFSPPSDMSHETGRPDSVQSAVEPAPDNTARTRTAAAAADDLRREKFMAKQSSGMAASNAAGDDAGVSAPVAAAAESLAPDPAQAMRIQTGVAAPGTRQEEAAFEDSAAVRDALTTEIETAEKRFQKTGATADARLETATTAPASELRFSQFQIKATGVTASSVRVTAIRCTGEQKSDVEEWWKCIDGLRQSGFAGTADLELNDLTEEFPEFEPPE